MKVIDNKTEFTKRAEMFAGGSRGYYRQEYTIFIDGERCAGAKNPTRVFVCGGRQSSFLRNVLDPARFDWQRDRPL